MSITKDPIFKSIMFALAVSHIGLISQSVWAAKGGKPDPGPVVAEDVNCIGCVDTVDIADEAVGTTELSADVQALLIQLNDRIDTLENLSPVVGTDCRPLNLVPGADLRNCTLNHVIIKDIDLAGANLSGSDLRGATISGVNLSNANLSNAKISGAIISSTNLTSANLDGVDGACDHRQCTGGNYAQKLHLYNSTDLTNASLVNANLASSYSVGAIFAGADLTNANLSQADLKWANFTGAILADTLAFDTTWDGAICPDGFEVPAYKSCEGHYR